MTSRPSRTQDSNSRLHTEGLRSGYENAYGTSSQPSESVFYGGAVESVSNRVAFKLALVQVSCVGKSRGAASWHPRVASQSDPCHRAVCVAHHHGKRSCLLDVSILTTIDST